MMWDEWRKQYDQMSFQDQVTFYAQFQDPTQTISMSKWGFYKKETVNYLQLILKTGIPHILELGGGDGSLAYNIVQDCPNIGSWYNYDFKFPPRFDIPNYHHHTITQWFWDYPDFQGYTHFISVETLEHIKRKQVELILSKLKAINDLIIEIPLPEIKTNWEGYDGSHILELSMNEFIMLFQTNGYSLFYRAGTLLHFRREQ